eukprot:364510-Chlamydomonas_euryale.AAC.10
MQRQHETTVLTLALSVCASEFLTCVCARSGCAKHAWVPRSGCAEHNISRNNNTHPHKTQVRAHAQPGANAGIKKYERTCMLAAQVVQRTTTATTRSHETSVQGTCTSSLGRMYTSHASRHACLQLGCTWT